MMKKFLVGATSTFALVLGLSTSANALEDDKDYRYRYSIKFICGWYEGDGDWYAAKIVPGYYATAINVYNPHDRNPFYQWNLKFTYPEGEGEWDWDRKNWDDDWGKRERSRSTAAISTTTRPRTTTTTPTSRASFTFGRRVLSTSAWCTPRARSTAPAINAMVA